MIQETDIQTHASDIKDVIELLIPIIDKTVTEGWDNPQIENNSTTSQTLGWVSHLLRWSAHPARIERFVKCLQNEDITVCGYEDRFRDHECPAGL